MPVLLTSLEPLVRALRDDGYRVVAPTVRDGATFGHAAGPQSWKSFLHPPQSPLWTARRDDGGCPVGIDNTEEITALAEEGSDGNRA